MCPFTIVYICRCTSSIHTRIYALSVGRLRIFLQSSLLGQVVYWLDKLSPFLYVDQLKPRYKEESCILQKTRVLGVLGQGRIAA